jgi:hypothetical protein
MRPLSLWHHELRRSGWVGLLPPVIAEVVLVGAAVDGAARLGQPARGTALVLQSSLELALPLAAGVAAGSLVGRDPAIELQLTMPTPYRGTILRRLIISAGWVALIALAAAAVMVASGWWDRWPGAHEPLAGQLTWLAPTLCLSGLGLLTGALSGSPATATSAVTALWFFHLAAGSLLGQHRWSRLLYLFATTRATTDDDWLANRLTLVAAGVAMVSLGWLLLRRPSRLLTKEAE